MRFGVFTLVAFVCAVVLGGSANSARTQGGADWTLRPVADGQKWFRVNVQGDTLHGFRLRGTDFTATGIKSVRASGGAAPQCSVSGTPATLACDGELPNGISVFVQLNVSGSGGGYEFALLFSPGDTNLLYVPSSQKVAPVPLGGSVGRTSPTNGRVMFHNPKGGQSFQQLEIAPVGFRATNVSHRDCGLTAGGGVACTHALEPGATFAVTFRTRSFSGAVGAFLLAQGNTTGLAYVPDGDPCVDLRANLTRLQTRYSALKAQIGQVQKRLARAERAVKGGRLARAADQLRAVRERLAGLRQRGVQWRKALEAAQALPGCGSAAAPTVAGVCDTEWIATGRRAGTVEGLGQALEAERRIRKIARKSAVLVKRAGGARSRPAIGRLNALVNLPRKTQKALLKATGASARGEAALTSCEAALAQD